MKYLVQIILFLFTITCVGQNTLFETDFQSGIPVEMSILNEDQFIPHSSHGVVLACNNYEIIDLGKLTDYTISL